MLQTPFGYRILVGQIFTQFESSTGNETASSTMGIGSFLGAKRQERGL